MKTRAPLQKRIGLVIRQHRVARSFTQEGFADHIRMHRAYYGALENGKKNLQTSIETSNLSRAYNCDCEHTASAKLSSDA